MKTKIKHLFAALLIMAAYSGYAQCGGPITYYVQTGGSVMFLDSANYGLSVQWDFGDGNTASDSDFIVSHTYTRSGTYIACATVTNSAVPCTTTYCDTLVINLCPGISSFSATQTGFGAYSFSNGYLNSSTSTWVWSFGVGDTSAFIVADTSNASSPSYHFPASGSYMVRLVLNDTTAGCSDTTYQTFNISLCSFANNFYSDSLGSNPYTFIVAQPVTGYSYTWHFGDGATGSGDTVTHSFARYSSYTTCLITSDATTGCSDSICNSQLVDPCGIYANTSGSSNGLIATFDVGFGWQGQNQSGLTYAWSFPGATPSSSASASATVNYSTTGTYTATVIITNSSSCADTLTQSVTITSTVSYFTISGNVYEGNNPGCGTVYLITQDTTGYLALVDSFVNTPSDTIVNGDTIYSCNGTYQFSGLAVDTYYVKAALDTGDPDYAGYLPTYYGDVLHWSGATPVVLSNSNATANIDLTLGSNPGGPGFVSGLISQGAGMQLFHGNPLTRGSGSYLAGVQVNLLTSNDDPVAYTYSDASGAFRFNNLKYGSYKIYVEQLNVAEVPDTFSLSAQNPGDSSVSFTVDSNSVTTTGVNNLSNISVSGIFPNPVSTLLDIEISSKVPADAILTLNDMLGQTVVSQKLHLVNGLNKGEMNMANLAAGVYQIVVQSNNQRLTYKVVKAQ